MIIVVSELVFLFKYSGEISFFCLHVKCILKPRPSGEVAATADGEGICRDFRPRLSVIFFFQAKKKEAKKSPGHLRLCPGPRNAFRY